MKRLAVALAAMLICGCAAKSSDTAPQNAAEHQDHGKRRQAALRSLGETTEGVRQAGASTVIVVCWECLSDSICDEFSLLRAKEMLDQSCPSGKGHATASAIGTAQTARACTAKCYKFEMPSTSYRCD
jgi:hypothetical protein